MRPQTLAISLAVKVGNTPIRISRATLKLPTAHYYLTAYDMAITNTGAVPATQVIVSFDWLMTPLFTATDPATGIAETQQGLSLPPVSGVYMPGMCLGVGTPRNSTMNVRVSLALVPAGSDSVITRLTLQLEAREVEYVDLSGM
jgi:hypothetical protein